MRSSFKGISIFLVSFVLGTLYAVLVGLIAGPLRAPLFALPVWVGLYWFVFWKFKIFRYTGFFAVLPVTLIGFEILWPAAHSGMNADKYVAFDRSHYTPGFRAENPIVNVTDPEGRGWGLKEIYIGEDGFRADPDTGKGNPDRCKFVVIGDSMIYGSGLPYPRTLAPVLAGMGVPACVYGVTGNSPVDYLATLEYVAERIEPGAFVAFYLYAYNDFVSLSKYFGRGFLTLTNQFPMLFRWAYDFDTWRRATFTHSFFRGERARRRVTLWQFDTGKKEPIRIYYFRDPSKYVTPRPLNTRRKTALQFFLEDLKKFAADRSWRVLIVIHPDDSEVYANLARRSFAFVDLDPRRADGLRICRKFGVLCEDISHYLYERSLAEWKNPYFNNDRHFSAFGMHVIAEHFVTLTKRVH